MRARGKRHAAEVVGSARGVRRTRAVACDVVAVTFAAGTRREEKIRTLDVTQGGRRAVARTKSGNFYRTRGDRTSRRQPSRSQARGNNHDANSFVSLGITTYVISTIIDTLITRPFRIGGRMAPESGYPGRRSRRRCPAGLVETEKTEPPHFGCPEAFRSPERRRPTRAATWPT